MDIDLIQRLRAQADGLQYGTLSEFDSTMYACREAADALESLQRENALLRHEQLQLADIHKCELEALKHDVTNCLNSASGEANYAEELRAENERLKHELEEVRKRKIPHEQFALVIDRSYDGEGISLAVHDGVNYVFSDGDRYERDGDTLGGWAAEFLTDHQLEKKLQESREDAANYRWLRENCLKIAPATTDGPAYPMLRFTWDIWAERPDTHNAAGLDAAISAARQQQG